MNTDQTSESMAAKSTATGHGDPPSTFIIPVLQETLRVERRQVEAGLVRVRKTVSEREDVVEAVLAREELHVERVPFDLVLTQVPPIREEGDVLIIPVVEEILIVEKRFRLTEEVRVTRSRSERTVQERVRLRTEAAAVEQTP